MHAEPGFALADPSSLSDSARGVQHQERGSPNRVQWVGLFCGPTLHAFQQSSGVLEVAIPVPEKGS